MATFRYHGLQNGKRCEGFLSAADRREVSSLLRQRNVRVVKLEELADEEISPHENLTARPVWERVAARFLVRRSESERMLFQLSSLLRAGVPILKGLRLTARLSPRLVQRSLFCVANRLSGGGTLHDQFRREAPFLDGATLSLVAVGEANGTLQEMLRYAANLLARRRKVKGDLLHALSYPALVVLAAGGAGWFMMEKVIPTL
jgi:type II secretory pathway component PulF